MSDKQLILNDIRAVYSWASLVHDTWLKMNCSFYH